MSTYLAILMNAAVIFAVILTGIQTIQEKRSGGSITIDLVFSNLKDNLKLMSLIFLGIFMIF